MGFVKGFKMFPIAQIFLFSLLKKYLFYKKITVFEISIFQDRIVDFSGFNYDWKQTDTLHKIT